MEGNGYAVPYQRTDVKLMIIVPKRGYLYGVKRVFSGHKARYKPVTVIRCVVGADRQRGSIILSAFGVPSGGGLGPIILSGETINDIDSGNRAYRAAVVMRLDGTVDKIENATATQLDSGTDWIVPNGDADAADETRYTSLTGDALDGTTSLAEDIWGTLAADKFFEQRIPGPAIESKSSTFTLEARHGSSGAAEDSASYTLNVERII